MKCQASVPVICIVFIEIQISSHQVIHTIGKDFPSRKLGVLGQDSLPRVEYVKKYLDESLRTPLRFIWYNISLMSAAEFV